MNKAAHNQALIGIARNYRAPNELSRYTLQSTIHNITNKQGVTNSTPLQLVKNIAFDIQIRTRRQGRGDAARLTWQVYTLASSANKV